MYVIYALISVIIVSLVAFTGLVVLPIKEIRLRGMVVFLVALSVGALFGDVIFHILPEIFEGGGSTYYGVFIAVGILVFFALEHFLLWHHRHGEDEETEETIHSHNHDIGAKSTAELVLVADGIHNFLDGIIITTAYMASIPIGIATTIAVIFHEIPQEISDFGILLHAGYSRFRALFLNFITALTAVLGVVIVYFLGERVANFVPFALAFTAGTFIYIAGSDLVPILKKDTNRLRSIVHFVAILIGFALMFLLTFFE